VLCGCARVACIGSGAVAAARRRLKKECLPASGEQRETAPMLGRVLSLVAAFLIACASTGAHGYARPLQPETAHRGFATAAEAAHRAQAHVTPEAASENSPAIAEASDGRRFYAKARYYGAGRGGFLSVDPWDGDPSSPVSLNKYLYGYANPGVYVDPDGRCGMLAFGAAGFGLGSVCDAIDAYTLGLDASTVDPSDKIMRYRLTQAQESARLVGSGVASAAETFGDVAVAGRERLTGESFGASERLGDRLGGAVDGTADYLGNLPVRVVDDLADFTWEFKQARATQDPERMGRLTAPVVVAGATAAAGIAAQPLRVAMAEGRAAGTVIEGSGLEPGVRFNDVDGEFGPINQPSSLAETGTPGLLRDTRTGRFVSDPFAVHDEVGTPGSGNRNLRSTQEPTIVYRIDVDGQGRKVGVSSVPPTGTGRYPRPADQVRELRELYGPEVDIRYRVLREYSERAPALDFEKGFLDRFKRLYGQYPGEGLPGGNVTNR
jgi:RHS repeat-associated protein